VVNKHRTQSWRITTLKPWWQISRDYENTWVWILGSCLEEAGAVHSVCVTLSAILTVSELCGCAVSSCVEGLSCCGSTRKEPVMFPDKFSPYREHIPPAERGDLIAAYYARLTSSDKEVRMAAAKQWCLWEMGTSKLIPDVEYIDKADNLDFAAAFSRIECHYFVNGIFVEDGYILKHVDKLKKIPVHIVQGRYDMVCPATSAWELHKAVPHSELVIVQDAGHSCGEVGIAKELVAWTNKYR